MNGVNDNKNDQLFSSNYEVAVFNNTNKLLRLYFRMGDIGKTDTETFDYYLPPNRVRVINPLWQDTELIILDATGRLTHFEKVNIYNELPSCDKGFLITVSQDSNGEIITKIETTKHVPELPFGDEL